MQQFVDLEFQWWRDTKGYELVNAPLPPDEELPPLAPIARWPIKEYGLMPEGFEKEYDFPEMPQRIVRLGGELVPYRPLDIIDDIFRAYINLRSGSEVAPDDILDFVDRYGPLTRVGLDENYGDAVELAVADLQIMNLYIDARVRDDGTKIRQMLAEGEIGVTGLIPKLIYDPATRSPKLKFFIPSLRSALLMHLMRSFDGGAALRRCEWEGCGIVFEAGAGTGRRADSKFCCDQHRIAYHSVHRSPRPAVDKGHQRRRGRPRRATA